MRAQQLHYKEYSLRENTYDQDVFFVQLGLVVLEPSLVFIAILDRFRLHEWLAGQVRLPPFSLYQEVETQLNGLVLAERGIGLRRWSSFHDG
jgi:hypothetical protein